MHGKITLCPMTVSFTELCVLKIHPASANSYLVALIPAYFIFIESKILRQLKLHFQIASTVPSIKSQVASSEVP